MENDNQVDAVKLNRLTYKQKAEIVWEYWFRHVMDNEYKQISIDNITDIIISYYDNLVAYEGKFIESNCASQIKVLNDNEIKIISGSYQSAKMDKPINMDDSVIYAWNFVFNTEKHNVTSFEIFGVVSNRCNNIGACPWGGLQDLYGLSADAAYTWSGTSDNFSSDEKHTKSINNGDVIRMELDCNKSMLVYKHEGEIFFEQELPERKAWYPAIGLGFSSWGVSAKFVPFES